MRGKERVNIDGIGPVLFESSKKARYMNISVKPFRGVRVAVPYGVPFSFAAEFARSKTGWIKKHQLRIKDLEQEWPEPVELDKKAARKKLTERINAISERYGLPFNRLFIRNQRTRWGSCSSKKNINLNIELVRLPEELMEYVIMHELVHTRVPSHGKAFWTALSAYLPESRLLDARLREHQIMKRSRK